MILFIAIVLAVIGGGILYEDSKSNRPNSGLQVMGIGFLMVATGCAGFFLLETFK